MQRSSEEPLQIAGQSTGANGLDRRATLKVLAALGFGGGAFSRALAAQAEHQPKVTVEMIKSAEWVSGIEFTDDDRKLMLDGLNEAVADYESLRAVPLDNGVPPAIRFHAQNRSCGLDRVERTARPTQWFPGPRPSGDDAVAFAPVTQLSAWVRSKVISSRELTRLYLERLKKFDALLKCMITLTQETAIQQAKKADEELAAGRYRGPLHGIPWGVKDLLAFPGYRTTWGAKPYENQVRKEKATVIARLEDAGAVLLAKLSVGALAWGDVWFGGTTKNPWKPEQGSSGSSAGPAAATAAGLAGFTIGTETLGSIVSPCTRCGATGLRPTFGRVSRFGAMALSWSMDKVGPIARSVEDCALVFDAIHGSDGLDPSAESHDFHWPPQRDFRSMRVGYVADLFDREPPEQIPDGPMRDRFAEQIRFDRDVLDVLKKLGVALHPIKLPDELPVSALALILTAEASTAFDELTRTGRDDLLVRQIENAWPNVFRQGQMIPAVEYLRANRIRTLLMAKMKQTLSQVDAYVCPSFGGSNLVLTNLTGHPAVVLPNGFRKSDGTPTSITFCGRLNGETELLAIAQAYQQATDFHRKHPKLES